MRGGPSAFPWASHPTVTSDARQGEDRPSDTGLRSRPRHHPDLQPTRSTHNVRLSCRTTTLRGSLLGGRELALLDHPGLEPLTDHAPGGEAAQRLEDVVVIDSVERPGQVRVQD